MNKVYLFFKKQLVLRRLHQWSSYLVLAGLCMRLFTPQIPIALAQPSSGGSYNLLPFEARQASGFSQALFSSGQQNFVSYENGLIQAFCPAGDDYCWQMILLETGNSKNRKAVTVTAYSSTPDQTDSTPFITANGTYVYDGLVACNFLPFGTKVKFPGYSGDKIFMVEDRMAKKNSHKVDIWMPTRQAALQFGVQQLVMEILE